MKKCAPISYTKLPKKIHSTNFFEKIFSQAKNRVLDDLVDLVINKSFLRPLLFVSS